MTTFIGDVHGKYNRLETIYKHCHQSIQIGDMGVGFFRYPDGEPEANPPFDKMVAGQHRFIRGNHDNLAVCKKHIMWIPDGHLEKTPKGTKLFFVGGAWSYDQPQRHRYFDWWPDEQCSKKQLRTFSEAYAFNSPDVMVTHDAPHSVCLDLFTGDLRETHTRQFLDKMWHMHRPKIWIFGHWHRHKDKEINDCRFICLDELETIDLEI
jgi:hypothetical protein